MYYLISKFSEYFDACSITKILLSKHKLGSEVPVHYKKINKSYAEATIIFSFNLINIW